MNAPPQPTRRFRALYTKHVRQKNKVYHDGFVLLRPSSVLLSLTDEAGRTLAVASAPAPAEQHPASDPCAAGLTVFDGFLVDLDGEDEGREGGGEGGERHDASAASATPLSLPFPRCSLVPAFRAPLRTAQLPQQQQQEAAVPPQYHQQQQRKPERRRVPLSDDEILGLLSGSLEAEKEGEEEEEEEEEERAAPPSPQPPPPRRQASAVGHRAGSARLGDAPGADAPSSSGSHRSLRGGGFSSTAAASASAAAATPRTSNGGGSNNDSNAPPRSVAAPPTPFSLLRAPPAWECCCAPLPPSATAAVTPLPPLRRLVSIPDTFPTAERYGAVLCAATVEELNLRLAAAARAFHAARGRVAARVALAAVAAGAGQSSLPEPPLPAVEQACRASGVAFYSRAELVVYHSAVASAAAASGNGNGSGGNWNKNRGGGRGGWNNMRRAFADEEDDDGNARPSSSPASSSSSSGTFLQLLSPREPSSAFSKGDLYVLSTAADLSPRRAGAVGDRLSAPWVAVARSSWHAPNAEGRLGVEIISCWQGNETTSNRDHHQQQQQPFVCLRKKGAVPVFALRAWDAASDLACLSSLSSAASLARLGALPALIAAPPAPEAPLYPSAATGKAAADAEAHAREAGLNEDQAGVMEAAAAWVSSAPPGAPRTARPPAVTVIHGPFGSGKSSLLVALVAFLANKAAEKEEAEEGESADGGSGKNPLPPGSGLRVLVVSHTNAAVDRVLTGLLDCGFEDIVRVGPLRRMSRALLPYSLHAAASGASTSTSASSGAGPSSASLASLASATASATAELEGMLRDATSGGARRSLGGGGGGGGGSNENSTASPPQQQQPALNSDAAAIAAELARVKAGAVRARAAALCRAAVVGTTCVSAGALPGMLVASLACSSGNNSNKRQRSGRQHQSSAAAAAAAFFDVAVVDEASQISEPLAAASLAAGGARYVVVAGDPMQLPPVVASPSAVSSASTSTSTAMMIQGNNSPPPAHGLARSLLSRLIAAGHGARLLRSQYRCHPSISAVANRFFYQNRLVDGVSAEQRPPLVPWLPPLALVDVRSGAAEEFNSGGGGGGGRSSRSVSNRAEAAAVVRLVARLRAAGVRPGSIGVVCFFRAQAELVRRLLLENQGQWQRQRQQMQAARQVHVAACDVAEEEKANKQEEKANGSKKRKKKKRKKMMKRSRRSRRSTRSRAARRTSSSLRPRPRAPQRSPGTRTESTWRSRELEST